MRILHKLALIVSMMLTTSLAMGGLILSGFAVRVINGEEGRGGVIYLLALLLAVSVVTMTMMNAITDYKPPVPHKPFTLIK